VGKGESSRGRGAASSEEDEEAQDGYEDDEEFVGGGVKKLGKDETLPVEAFVLDVSPLYEDDRGGELEPAAAATAGDDPAWGVKERIRKMLELGLHADTGEAEAKQAMQNAMRLLTKHNLERADVLRAHGSDASALQGGLKVVELTGRRAAQLTAWMRELSNVAARAFDVSYYTTATGGGRGGQGAAAQVVFYGLAGNAACAAYAFAAAVNRILALSARFPVTRAGYHEHRAAGLTQCTTFAAFSRVCRASYRVGLVHGLSEGGLAAPGAAPAQGKAAQEAEWRARYQQLLDDEPSAGAGEDADADTPKAGGGFGGEDDRARRLSALILHTKTVGNTVLEAKGIKLRAGPRFRLWGVERNAGAFNDGRRDAAQIDVHRRGITVRRKRPRTRR
jgi:hypothetical protein